MIIRYIQPNLSNPCPVCGYHLRRPAQDCDICPSCGTQFGYSDSGTSYDALREHWMQWGMPWMSRAYGRPQNWNPIQQLISAELFIPSYSVQQSVTTIRSVDLQPNRELELEYT